MEKDKKDYQSTYNNMREWLKRKQKEEAAKRYIQASLEHQFASGNGTDLNAALPKMSPLNPNYLTKKQEVHRKISAFVEKFKNIGGEI